MYRSSLFWTAALFGSSVALLQPAVSAKSLSEIESIAKAVTVEIKRQKQNDNGSGIIIQKQGNLYTLVTNRHVICGNSSCSQIPANEVFILKLPDGQKYKVPKDAIKLLDNSDDVVDLAIIQFRINSTYALAKIAAPESLKINSEVYASGFPCERNLDPSIPCQPLGYTFSQGRAMAVVNKRLIGDRGGYTIIYNAFTLPGMSGGGIFDSDGQLVAIHGRGDQFTENTDIVSEGVTKAEVGSKIGYNRGIPVRWLVKNLAEIGINLVTDRSISSIRATRSQEPSTADEHFITGFNNFVEPGDNVVAGKNQAIQEFTKAIQLNPNYQYAYFLRACTYRQVRKFQQSLVDFNQAILINPRYFDAHYNRANLKQTELNDIQGALADFNQAIIINPKYVVTYNNRASLKYTKLNDIQGAMADFNQAIALDPKYSTPYFNRAILKYFQLNDTQGALADYSQAISLNPRDFEAYNNRALLKDTRLHDIPGALADLNQSILLNSKNFKAYNNRANLKINRLNDIQGALNDYNQAISLNPKYSEVYNNRALLKYPNLNDIQGALADYNQAISIDPKYAKAYNNRAFLKYTKLNDIQGALADYSQAISIDPKYAKAYNSRALMKYKMNDREGSIQDCRQAARLFREQGNNQGLQDAIDNLKLLGATE
jgi:tetratricopeptide (TPR) repeat protein/S1-C subfamily serine protease